MDIEVAIFLAIASGFAGFVDANGWWRGINPTSCINNWIAK